MLVECGVKLHQLLSVPLLLPHFSLELSYLTPLVGWGMKSVWDQRFPVSEKGECQSGTLQLLKVSQVTEKELP